MNQILEKKNPPHVMNLYTDLDNYQVFGVKFNIYPKLEVKRTCHGLNL
jgi:hypothetical protein